MEHRSYDQFCGLAGALDLLGERWTLLVVRELMVGPKRYTDLAGALKGIGTSMLASRLKRLEAEGIVIRETLPPPAASTVYRLSTVGDELAEALHPLIRWGLKHAVPQTPGPTMRIRAEWSLVAFTHTADPEALAGIDATYAFVVEGNTAYLRVRDGRARALDPGEPREPDLTLRFDAATVKAVGSGELSVREAVMSGAIEFEGDPAAFQDLERIFNGA